MSKVRFYSALYNDPYPWAKMGEVIPIADPNKLVIPEGVKCILLLHGGADISPSIYGERPGPRTDGYFQPSARDRAEIRLVRRAMLQGMPMLGICRGAQLLTAVAGGKLVQDVDNHQGRHDIKLFDGGKLNTNSVHHQMCMPYNIPHEMIGWTEGRAMHYFDQRDKPYEWPKNAYDENGKVKEPELFYLPTIKGLCIQGHPEYERSPTPFQQYSFKLVEEKLLNG